MTGSLKSWIATANVPDCEFPIQNLPYGVFSQPGAAPCCGVAIGDMILDLAACEARGLVDAGGAFAQGFLFYGQRALGEGDHVVGVHGFGFYAGRGLVVLLCLMILYPRAIFKGVFGVLSRQICLGSS